MLLLSTKSPNLETNNNLKRGYNEFWENWTTYRNKKGGFGMPQVPESMLTLSSMKTKEF